MGAGLSKGLQHLARIPRQRTLRLIRNATFDLPQGRIAERSFHFAHEPWGKMTNGELARDLSRIDGILALMQTYRRFDDEDLEDEIWLRRRRR